ncbi:iron complex transport system ATP-binding protein [Rhizobium sp. BK275]|uniref:ABC transporter ATP-binding protein n=1 Tax=unclassified Rhizobium TaxID=2613769 RepID=UPI00160E908B|nr:MULTISPECIES: ABC transporter ATP-binding protein [unclassified Rhizobium]MBB3387391.1 iron complex transport system ATP-binding protein [Rhizobium sp. BK275]MBB3406747.1 iron complex transport system ATP-binding protein [Rhizobium sp. BK316]
MTVHTLTATGLSAGYGEDEILHGLDLAVPPGKITVIVGANACGKSTLLRAMSRLLSPRKGQVLLDGKSIHRTPPRDLARTLGLLPQSPIAPEGITVADLVSRGRHPHQSLFSRWTRADDEAVDAALTATNTSDLAERPVDELSGGQRQRVWIAMALAQQTEILLLDEPTTFLDISHQVEVLDLLTDLNHARGTTVVMVLHDLNLAARYADYLVAMTDGSVHVSGLPQDVLTEDNVRQVFGLQSRIITDPTSGRPIMLPIGRHRMAEGRADPQHAFHKEGR